MSEERVTAKNTGKQNNAWNVDDEHIRRMSGFIRHSIKGKLMYRWMMTLMFLESVLWTLLDITRASRMKMAEKISQNKHIDRVTRKK
jgi:hypothetical protein